jgi:hypothetical protein
MGSDFTRMMSIKCITHRDPYYEYIPNKVKMWPKKNYRYVHISKIEKRLWHIRNYAIY